MKLLLVLIAIIAITQGYLITQSQIDKLKESGFQFSRVGGGLQIPETTCNVVDPTPILPPGQSADNYVVRSGFLKMGKGNSAFGFIFWGSMEAKGEVSKLKDYPTLIWLQGGPGGSSQFGDFTEMGPIMVDGDGTYTYTYNEYSWNQKYNMIFIDNPIGTGLSYAEKIDDIPTDQIALAKDFYNGLEQLYTAENGCFNVLDLTETPLFISGESYAGKYVPNYAHHILQQNSSSVVKQALLKGGIAVGDGFTDPKTIMDVLPMFGYNLSMINQRQRANAQLNAQVGDQNISDEKFLSAQSNFNDVMNELVEDSGLENVYNWADNQNKGDSFNLSKWLNSKEIKVDVFQFPEKLFYSSQSLEVYLALSRDFMQTNVVSLLEKVLDKDFPVLFYNGQNDVIVCTPCTEEWLDLIEYSGQPEFGQKTFDVWTTHNKVSGYYKQSDNLMFVTVNQAGHMVPMDQPAASYNMITNFVDYVVARNNVKDKKEFDNKYGMFKSHEYLQDIEILEQIEL